MCDIRDNVDLNWIARTLVALRTDVSDLKHDMRALREDLGALTMRVIRMDNELHALGDDARTLFELHGGPRGRVEALERK
jgi:hypothetical protein